MSPWLPPRYPYNKAPLLSVILPHKTDSLIGTKQWLPLHQTHNIHPTPYSFLNVLPFSCRFYSSYPFSYICPVASPSLACALDPPTTQSPVPVPAPACESANFHHTINAVPVTSFYPTSAPFSAPAPTNHALHRPSWPLPHLSHPSVQRPTGLLPLPGEHHYCTTDLQPG